MIGRTNAGGGGTEFIKGSLSAKGSEVVIPCPKEPSLVVCRHLYTIGGGWCMAACGGFDGGSSTIGTGFRLNSAPDDPQAFSPKATYSDGYITMSTLVTSSSSYTWNYYIAY